MSSSAAATRRRSSRCRREPGAAETTRHLRAGSGSGKRWWSPTTAVLFPYGGWSDENRAMKYEALATDYDGTIALDGRVDEPTLVALQQAKASGVRMIMVTGRQLPDLLNTFP